MQTVTEQMEALMKELEDHKQTLTEDFAVELVIDFMVLRKCGGQRLYLTYEEARKLHEYLNFLSKERVI